MSMIQIEYIKGPHKGQIATLAPWPAMILIERGQAIALLADPPPTPPPKPNIVTKPASAPRTKPAKASKTK